MKKSARGALFVLVAIAGAAAGFLSYRHYAERPTLTPVPARAATSAVASAMQPSKEPPAPAAEAAPPETSSTRTIPELVPDVRIADLAGHEHALRSNPGHMQLFNFWATWCEPCRREIPLLNTLQGAYSAAGLQVVGIAVDQRAAVAEYIKSTHLNYTVLVGEDAGLEAALKFGMDLALPFSVFADAHNRIIAVKVGELHREDADAILGEMKSLAAGKQTLDATRRAIGEALRALAANRAKQSAGK